MTLIESLHALEQKWREVGEILDCQSVWHHYNMCADELLAVLRQHDGEARKSDHAEEQG